MASQAHSSRLQVRNPATGGVLAEVEIAGPAQVQLAVDRARAAQVAWGQTRPRDRAKIVTAFRKALARHAEQLAARISEETGKPRHEALLMEVLPLVDLIAYFCRRAPGLLRPRRIRLHLLPHRRSYLHFRPKGVVGVVSPWNFPLAIPLGEVAMALLAGNSVVLKPSDLTPLIALEAKRLWDECGAAPDLFQVVAGGAQTGRSLVEASIDHVSFTGSVAAGRAVAAACGQRLVTCTLELGGKAPAIVCADADVERTARALVWGGFANSGQVCAAVERVYVVGPLYEVLLARVTALVRELRIGDPSQEVDVGSMTFPHQVEVVSEQVADAVTRGARIESGGEAPAGPGLVFLPTVLSGVTQDMRVMREETFGPILPMMRVESEEEAIRLANDSSLGLNAYVFSRDTRRARSIAERVEAGTVMIDDVLATHGAPETPWGGVKQSGIGRVHGELGLMDLVQVRHVNYPAFKVPAELWWFPYRRKVFDLTIRFIRRVFG